MFGGGGSRGGSLGHSSSAGGLSHARRSKLPSRRWSEKTALTGRWVGGVYRDGSLQLLKERKAAYVEMLASGRGVQKHSLPERNEYSFRVCDSAGIRPSACALDLLLL